MDAINVFSNPLQYEIKSSLNYVLNRFPCVTRRYATLRLDIDEIGEIISNDQDFFLQSIIKYSWDYVSLYNKYYQHSLNCSQSLLYGVKRALEISPAESLILVYTFGSMVDNNDTQLLSDVYTLLEKKKSQVYFLLDSSRSSCSMTSHTQDVLHDIVSRSYGGTVDMRSNDDVMMIHSFELLLSKPLNSSVRILNINQNVTDDYKESFNVTTSIKHLLITRNGLIDLNLTDPNGNVYELKKTSYNRPYNYQSVLSSHVIKRPAAGSWILKVQGNVSLSVHIIGFTGLNITGKCSDSGCHTNASCWEFGGYGECTCKEGFSGDGISCTDIDECQDPYLNGCYMYYGYNSYCVNTIGSYTCDCTSGYQYEEGFGCVDIDECADSSLNNCDPLANCTNYSGYFSCACPYGYYGEGYYCEVNECVQKSPCEFDEDCILQYNGSYSCYDPCSKHTVLNDPWRSTSFIYRYLCDNNLSGWYRFKGDYDQRIPEYCVPQEHCGAEFPIWMNGSHPTVSDGIVNRTACVSQYEGCCTDNLTISVRMCPENFYVYKLESLPHCSTAYCTERDNSCFGVDCAPDEECRSVGGNYSCYCNNSSYSTDGIQSGNGKDLRIPQVTCGLENIEVKFSKCLLEKLEYNTSSIHLTNDSCRGVSERRDKSYITITTRPQNGSCGGYIWNNGSNITYTNTVYLTSDSGEEVPREIPIDFYCVYSSDMEMNLLTGVRSNVMSSISVGGIENYTVSMGLFQDSNSTSLYSGSEVWLDSSSILHVGIMVTESDSLYSLVLIMKNCYTTPTTNGFGTRYDIITNRCPNKNDPTISVTENGESLRGRFSLQVFKFLGGFNQLYLHCQVGLCNASIYDCSARCQSKRSVDGIDNVHDITLGPINQKGTESSSGGTAVQTGKCLISVVIFLLLLF